MSPVAERIVARRKAVIARLAVGLSTAEEISRDTGISKRQVYRYISDLAALGFRIKGAAGAGYLMLGPPAKPQRIGVSADELRKAVA